MLKKWLSLELSMVLLAALSVMLQSCKENKTIEPPTVAMENKAKAQTKKPLSQEFKKYWYAGKAEITSYELDQARYGESRKGTAVLIYVTEPFLPEKQVKADNSSPDNIPVLKLNATKNYLTGIYPYSIMTSSFYPVHDNEHALKVSFSSQEWCGQVYMQLNNRDDFEIRSNSYFEKEADQNFNLEKVVLENELWNQIRIDPKNMPIGKFQAIPSFEYIRLAHKTTKAYAAEAQLEKGEKNNIYTISYPELNRTLTINYRKNFPYEIESWSETFSSGFGDNAKMMTTTAKKINKITTPYWQQNSNEYLYLRDSLGL
jgi:hypothetical protein